MTDNTDLWPDDLLAVIPRTPKHILLEQASALGNRTKNIVQAKVETDSFAHGGMFHAFILVAPALGNYEYRLFKLTHDLELYPVQFEDEESLANETELKNRLAKLFSEERTKNVIRALVANSRTESPQTPSKSSKSRKPTDTDDEFPF